MVIQCLPFNISYFIILCYRYLRFYDNVFRLQRKMDEMCKKNSGFICCAVWCENFFNPSSNELIERFSEMIVTVAKETSQICNGQVFTVLDSQQMREKNVQVFQRFELTHDMVFIVTPVNIHLHVCSLFTVFNLIL